MSDIEGIIRRMIDEKIQEIIPNKIDALLDYAKAEFRTDMGASGYGGWQNEFEDIIKNAVITRSENGFSLEFDTDGLTEQQKEAFSFYLGNSKQRLLG